MMAAIAVNMLPANSMRFPVTLDSCYVVSAGGISCWDDVINALTCMNGYGIVANTIAIYSWRSAFVDI